ncbi:MAG: M48 family metalloprotease [Acidimicrobiales bacterium]
MSQPVRSRNSRGRPLRKSQGHGRPRPQSQTREVAPPPPPAVSPYEVLSRQAVANRRRARLAVGLTPALPSLVLAVVVGALLGWWLVPIVLVGLTAAAAAGLWRLGPGIALRDLDLHPLAPVGREAAGLHNLVEGLCAVAGLPKPRLLVLDDPSANCLVVGSRGEDTRLVVTSGLLPALSRIEMEGVVAHQLSHIRRGDAVVGAAAAVSVAPLSVLLPSLGARATTWLLGGREAPTDVAAVGLTRFPPGLASALEQMSSLRTAASSPRLDLLWDIAPEPAAGAVRPGRTGLRAPGNRVEDRISALREL